MSEKRNTVILGIFADESYKHDGESPVSFSIAKVLISIIFSALFNDNRPRTLHSLTDRIDYDEFEFDPFPVAPSKWHAPTNRVDPLGAHNVIMTLVLLLIFCFK